MRSPVAGLLCCCAALSLAVDAAANTRRTGVDFAGQRASLVEDKRVPFKRFDAPMDSQFAGKTFEMKSWKKHFSPWGTKRAAIDGRGDERKVFKTDTIEFPEKEFKLARWNQQLADLERQARVSTGDDAGMATDIAARGFRGRETYDSKFEEATRLDEMGEELSLRDVNRYLFRRNRADSDIPVTAAASSEG